MAVIRCYIRHQAVLVCNPGVCSQEREKDFSQAENRNLFRTLSVYKWHVGVLVKTGLTWYRSSHYLQGKLQQRVVGRKLVTKGARWSVLGWGRFGVEWNQNKKAVRGCMEKKKRTERSHLATNSARRERVHCFACKLPRPPT